MIYGVSSCRGVPYSADLRWRVVSCEEMVAKKQREAAEQAELRAAELSASRAEGRPSRRAEGRTSWEEQAELGNDDAPG